VAAISPAIWTSYEQVLAVNPGAYASAGDFAACDAVSHAAALSGAPVRVASGNDDPCHPGVLTLAQKLPKTSRSSCRKAATPARFSTPRSRPS
jgi:hypothetical protein